MNNRSSWKITRNVWYALYMREMATRMFGNRYAWFWLIAEPMLFVGLIVFIRAYADVFDRVSGVELVPWMIIGLSSFFLFRDSMLRGMGAVSANKALFAYRQVKPVDTVIVRVFVEGTIHSVVLLLFMIVLLYMGYDVIPDNFLFFIVVWFILWFFGLGVALTLSALVSMVSDIKKIISVISLPLLIVSGAIIPIQFIPVELHSLLLINPVLHLVELIRGFYFSTYSSVSGISFYLVSLSTITLLFIGFMLHVKYEKKIKTA